MNDQKNINIENEYNQNYYPTQMAIDTIITKLKENGFRMTKQRILLLDTIMENEVTCCKEIYYKAIKKNKKIGLATVYRMVNILESIGAINRKNMYKILDIDDEEDFNICNIELDDHSIYKLSARKLKDVLISGLKACGMVQKQKIKRITINYGKLKNLEQERKEAD